MSGFDNWKAAKSNSATSKNSTGTSGFQNWLAYKQNGYKPIAPAVVPAAQPAPVIASTSSIKSTLPNYAALKASLTMPKATPATSPTIKQPVVTAPVSHDIISKPSANSYPADKNGHVAVPNQLQQLWIDITGTKAQKDELQKKNEINLKARLNNTTATDAGALNFWNSVSLGAEKPLSDIAKNNFGYDNGFETQLQKTQQQHPIASTVGQVAGYLAPGSLVDKGVSMAAKPLLEKAGATIAGKIASRAITSGVSNAALVAASDKLQGASNAQTAKDAAIQGLIGGVLGGGMGAIGERAAIKTATRELGAKGLVTPASKIPSNIAKAAEDRAVANANRLLPAESNGTTSVRPKLTFDSKGNLVSNTPVETPTTAKLSPVVNDAVKADMALSKAQTGADSVLKPVERARIEVTTSKVTSPELQALETQHLNRVQQLRETPSYVDREMVNKQLKAEGMQYSAKKRALIQGDSLKPVNGGFTPKELDNRIKYLNTNYVGKQVTAGGQEGMVKGNVYGKVSVQRADGTVKNYLPSEVVGFGKQTVGAAEYKPTVTKDLIDKYGQIDTGENPTRIMQVPNKTADNMAVSKYVRTVGESKNVTDGQAISLENKAAKGDFSHIIKTDKAAVANADKVVSDEGVSGATRRWERVVNGTRPATKDDMAVAQQLLTEAYTRGDIAGAERLVSQITVEGTRSGQVVQSMRLLKKMTPQGKLYYLQKYVDKANSDLAEKIGNRATKIEISPDLAKQLLSAKTTQEIGEAEKQIIIEVAKQTPATWGDRLNAWRYMSMLANPLTHLRNIYGNIFFQPVRKFASLITAGAEKVMRVPVGERTSSVLIPFKDKALKDFARNDYKEIGDILHGGKFNENSNIINDNKPIFVSKNKLLNTLQKPLEATRKGSMWGLSHEDIFFSKPAYADYMAQYMKANKLTPEFLGSGTEEATAVLEKGRTYAIQQAKRATFNEANSFATWINQSEKKLLQHGTPGKVGYMAIEGLTPFKKTPFNIVKRGLEYSPLNLIKSVSTDLIKVNTGKMAATDAIRHFAEGLTGTGLMGLGMFLAAQGLITGKVDTTGKQGDYDAQNGVQQYSLNIGNHSYTINWLAPEIMPIMMGSEIYQSFIKDNPKDVMGASTAAFNHLLSAASSITDPVFDLTMLQGVNNLFSQSFGSSAAQQIEKIIPSFAGQFVPTALGQVARISQPNRKDASTTDPMNKLLGINKVVAKIPGFSNTLPDKQDLWGKPISNGSLPLRLFSNLASPGYLGTKQNSPVDTEVQRLKTATNNTAALPAAAPSTITDPNTKKTIYMTAKEKALYQQIMGQTAFSALSQLINDPLYKQMPDQQNGATNDKLSFVGKVYTDARAKAVNTILASRGIKIPTAAEIKVANRLTGQQKSQSRQGTTLNNQIGIWTK